MRFILIFISILALQTAVAQDTAYARKTINTLCQNKFYGRGYYKNGAVKAADFIASEMKKAGVKPLPQNKKYFQPFNFNVNTVEQIHLVLNGKVLRPGYDYIIDAGVNNFDGIALASSVISEKTLMDTLWFKELVNLSLSRKESAFYNNFVFIDTLSAATEKKYKNELNIVIKNNKVVQLKKKLTWTVATNQTFWKHIEILHTAVERSNNYTLHLNVKSHFGNTKQKNVLGYVKGSTKPDSFIFITAHYDHLGMMGKTAMFPGANDNACGVAMMLDMARYYAKNPQKYSMVFVAFAGEEAGLLGSEYYTQNPVVPLNKTRFLMNLDLVGTGEEGGTVVNATVFKNEFARMDSLNTTHHYLPKLVKRNKAANSDHYFFTEAGVPSFFLYLAGPRSSYHDVFDIPGTVTLAGYQGTFRLVRDLINNLQ